MSIINEALKKAEREKGIFAQGEPIRVSVEDARKNLEMEFRRRPRVNWSPVFIILVLVLITAPIVGPIVFPPFRTAGVTNQLRAQDPRDAVMNRTRPIAPPAPSPMSRGQFGVEERFIGAPMMPPSTLHLSGIVFSPTDSYAIVNDMVLKVGDRIQGATVKTISKNEVMLERGDQTIRLATEQ